MIKEAKSDEILLLYAGDVDDYHTSLSSEAAYAEAESDGLEVRLPANNELFLDFDTEESRQVFFAVKPVFDRYFTITNIKEWPSRSGLPKRHMVVTLDRDVTPLERIAFQACLGSDRVRELLGLARITQDDKHPTLFLEKKNDEIQTPEGKPSGIDEGFCVCDDEDDSSLDLELLA